MNIPNKIVDDPTYFTDKTKDGPAVMTATELLGAGAGLTCLNVLKCAEPVGLKREFSPDGSMKRTCSVFSLYLSGERVYRYDGGSFTLRPGNLLYIPQNGRYNFEITKGVGGSDLFTAVNFLLYRTTPGGNCIPVTLSREPKVLLDDAETMYSRRFSAILFEYRQQTNVLKVQSMLYELFCTLMIELRRRELGMRFSAILPAIDLLESHLYEQVTVDELAHRCCMSVTSFRRTFSEYSGGISPIDYRNRLRLQKAEEILATDGATVEYAARQTGFCDASHLHRMFRKYRGTTPRGKKHTMD